MPDTKREPGWYWVTWGDDDFTRTIGHWDGYRWLMPGCEEDIDESQFAEIGPRIPSPEQASPSREELQTCKDLIESAVGKTSDDRVCLSAAVCILDKFLSPAPGAAKEE